MKRNSPLVRQSRSVDIDSAMTPMIDVVFLLLVFFVWTASFVAVEQVLPSQLSSQLGEQATDVVEPPEPSDFDQVIVRVGVNENQVTWSINDQPLADLLAVEQQLRALAAAALPTPIILHPQSAVPLGEVIETYDVAKRCGFENISFAVNAVP